MKIVKGLTCLLDPCQAPENQKKLGKYLEDIAKYNQLDGLMVAVGNQIPKFTKVCNINDLISEFYLEENFFHAFYAYKKNSRKPFDFLVQGSLNPNEKNNFLKLNLGKSDKISDQFLEEKFYDTVNTFFPISADAGLIFNLSFEDEINSLEEYIFPIRRFKSIDFSSGRVSLSHHNKMCIRNINWINYISDELIDRYSINIENLSMFHTIEFENGRSFKLCERPLVGDCNLDDLSEPYYKFYDQVSQAVFVDFQVPYLNAGRSVDGIELSKDWATRFRR